MPELRKVLPALTDDAQFQHTEAYQLRDQQVTAFRLATGAPCSSKGELFASWPGPEKNIIEWYVLENGYAVGRGTDADGQDCYPVARLNSDLT